MDGKEMPIDAIVPLDEPWELRRLMMEERGLHVAPHPQVLLSRDGEWAATHPDRDEFWVTRRLATISEAVGNAHLDYDLGWAISHVEGQHFNGVWDAVERGELTGEDAVRELLAMIENPVYAAVVEARWG